MPLDSSYDFRIYSETSATLETTFSSLIKYNDKRVKKVSDAK